MAGATVIASNVETGVETSRKTTEAGFFVLSPLQPGEYTVTVKAEGFQTYTQQHVVVVALGTIGLSPKLALGTASQSITVEAAPPLLHTDDATLGSSMENRIYAALPLQMNGVPRDPTQFVALVPGVNNASTQAAGPSTAAFNGGQTYQNEVYLEGIPLTSAGTQGDTRYLALAVSVDAVDQFQVETNGAKAQYEGQGVENYVLKSGTNGFHGAAFEYFRNTDLDARGFFPANRPADHQNEFGGILGGPIKKNKLFFFGNYDGYRYLSGSTPNLQSIPTAAERTGDFSGLPAAQVIYDPASQTCAGAVCTRTPFAGNVIPLSKISAISKSLASYLPDPTNANIQNNYLSSLPIQVNTYNLTGKVDANLSDRHRLYGFFADGHYTTNFTGSLNQTGAGVLPEPYTQGRIVAESVKMGQLHDTYTLYSVPGEPGQHILQSHLDSPFEPYYGGGLSAEGRDQGPAAKRRPVDFPGHQFQRHQFTRRLAGNQRPLLQRGRQHLHGARQPDVGQRQPLTGLRFPVPGIAGQREFRAGGQLQLQQRPNAGVQCLGNTAIYNRQCLRQLPAGRNEQQRGKPERHRRDWRAV